SLFGRHLPRVEYAEDVRRPASRTTNRVSRKVPRRPSRGNVSTASASPEARSSTADRKSTRLNSSHVSISYAVFCLKKKNNPIRRIINRQRGVSHVRLSAQHLRQVVLKHFHLQPQISLR